MNTEKSNPRKNKTNEQIIDSYDYLANAASKQDMTGLIPSEPVSAAELEAYEELYHFLPPNGRVKNIKDESQTH